MRSRLQFWTWHSPRGGWYPDQGMWFGANTTDQLRTTTAELSAHQRSTVDASEQLFTLDNRHGPIWGSRGREFKSRQPDNSMSDYHTLIRAAFIRPAAHPRLASAPGSWAQIGPTSASTPPRHRARPGDPGE
jgi:hypothetical protein